MQYDPVYDDRFDGRTAVANSPAAAKALFVQRTYGHLFGAILAFAGIEAALFASGAAEGLVKVFFSLPFAQLLLIGAVIGGGFVAQMLADSSRSKPMQYLGLGLYVLLEVAIFLPILYVAELRFPGQHLPAQAGIVTLLVFGALTTAVFLSGKDFSFMGPFLAVAGFAAMGVILGGWLFGFHLGLLFSAAMIVLAAGYIVYDTSNVMHRYDNTQYVPAALALFASVAMLFYYILRIFMSNGRSNN